MLVGKQDEKSEVKGYFKEYFSDQGQIEWWESIYDQNDFTGFCVRARMNQALSWLDASNLSKNAIILDAGSGAGVITHEIAKRGYKAIGVDYSYGMLEKANGTCSTDRKLIEKFLQADIESLPFNDSSFDMIICLGVIAYFKSEEKLLREFSRVLKESGVLILSSLNKAHLVMYFNDPSLVKDILRKLAKNTLKKIFGSRIETWKKKTRMESGPPARRRYLTPELENSLQLQGFSVLEYTTVPLELLTFRGRTILPLRANIKITMFLERFSNIPFIGTLGGMCIFRARKNPDGRRKESSLLQSA